jgi:hypothetical protein
MALEISKATAAGEDARGSTRGGAARRWRPHLRLGFPRITRTRLIVLGVLGFILLLWSLVVALSTTTYGTTVLFTEQDNGIGLPPPTESLDFGDVPAGGQMHRNVNLENNGGLDTFVVVIPWGGIRDFFHVDNAFFNIAPGDKHAIDFSVSSPANTPHERHSGRVFIVRLPWWSPF